MDTPSKPDATQEETVARVIATKPTRRWRAWVFQVYVVTAAIGFGILFLVAGAFTYFPIERLPFISIGGASRAFLSVNPWLLISLSGLPHSPGRIRGDTSASIESTTGHRPPRAPRKTHFQFNLW